MKVKNPKLSHFKQQKTIKLIIICLCVLVASGSGYLGFKVFQQISDFDIDNLTSSATSIQVNQNKKTYYKYGAAAGKYVKYSSMPEVLIDAVVSAEDSRFFVHDGFDIPRIVKAFFSNIKAGSTVAGGSTITQQLIKKTYYPNEERTIQRKLGEVILSIEATQQTTKQKIIELYLNKIYFGKSTSTIGIYAASYYYFGKNPSKLTLPEAALLAGTINSPVSYDPFNNLKLATQRRNVILNLMYQHGYITKAQCETTKKVKVQNTLSTDPIKTNKKYAAYADKVTKEVKSKTGYDPSTTNMTIYTYMDTDIQKTLDDISSQKTYTFTDPDMQAGSVVQESKTGRIIGILSARDYKAGSWDYAYSTGSTVDSRQQPGSSIKPVLDYATAFEYLYWSTGHYASDTPYSSGGWTPKNWDNSYHGDVTLYDALGKSWNLAAIQTLNSVIKAVGKDKIVAFLKKLGYKMSDESFSLSYAIGGWSHGVTAAQQAAAYAAISNGGTYIEPHTVEKVVINTTGETIYIDKEIQTEAVQAMTDSTAFMLREVLTTVVKRYSNYSALNIGDSIGAKTGTSNHDGTVSGIAKGVAKDHWLCCFSPDYAWATWNGYPASIQKSKHKYLRGGQNDAKNISNLIAKALHKKGLKNSYETPDDVVQAKMITGIYPYVSPGSGVPSNRIATAWFVKGHTPTSSANGTSLNDLSSFTATVNSQNQIIVSFTQYDPVSLTKSSTPRKTYTVNGHSYSLPYYGDISQIYGRVVYRVQVYNGSTLVSTQSLSSNKEALSFSAAGNTTYTLIGYYAWASGSGTSNKITTTVKTGASVFSGGFSATVNGAAVSSGSTITGTAITFATSGNSSHTMAITLSGGSSASQTVSCGSSATFSNLVANTAYTATFVESDGSSSQNVGSFTFTTGQ